MLSRRKNSSGRVCIRLSPQHSVLSPIHLKDLWWNQGDGTVGGFGDHTTFADPRRYWDFRSLGRGNVDFERIIAALHDIGYHGPLSVEWEDSRMDREHGAAESAAFVRRLDFKPGAIAFDGQFDR